MNFMVYKLYFFNKIVLKKYQGHGGQKKKKTQKTEEPLQIKGD